MVESLKCIATTFFKGLTGCVREQERYQRSTKNDTQIHSQINATIVLEKAMQTTYKFIEHGDEEETHKH